MSILDLQWLRRLMNFRAFCCLLSLATTDFHAVPSAIAGDHREGQTTSPTIAAPHKISAEIDKILWWLPEDTETILISNGKVPVGVASAQVRAPTTRDELGPLIPPTQRHPFSDPPYRYEDIVASVCISPLVGFSPLIPEKPWVSLVREFYGTASAKVFVKAARPASDGTTEACDIVLFQDDSPARLLKAIERFQHRPLSIDSTRIVAVELNGADESIRHDVQLPPKRRYLTSPLPGVYIAATSERLLRAILDRIRQRGAVRALSADIPEWKQLDIAAPAWAIRHYPRQVAEKSRTSMVKWDPNARGLVFFCGKERTSIVSLRYLSTSQDAGRRFIHMRSEFLGGVSPEVESRIPPLLRINDDAVEDCRRTNVAEIEARRDAMSVCQTSASIALYLSLLGFGPDD